MRQVAGSLRLDLSQYRELRRLLNSVQTWIGRPKPRLGEQRMYEVLKQEQYKPIPVEEQAVSLYIAVNGYIDNIPTSDVVRFEREFLDSLRKEHGELLAELRSTKAIDGRD